jgi:hypothetical protein
VTWSDFLFGSSLLLVSMSVGWCVYKMLTLPPRTTGLLLPGWFCQSCRAFNGAAKETLTHCRACSTKAP